MLLCLLLNLSIKPWQTMYLKWNKVFCLSFRNLRKMMYAFIVAMSIKSKLFVSKTEEWAQESKFLWASLFSPSNVVGNIGAMKIGQKYNRLRVHSQLLCCIGDIRFWSHNLFRSAGGKFMTLSRRGHTWMFRDQIGESPSIFKIHYSKCSGVYR